MDKGKEGDKEIVIDGGRGRRTWRGREGEREIGREGERERWREGEMENRTGQDKTGQDRPTFLTYYIYIYIYIYIHIYSLTNSLFLLLTYLMCWLYLCTCMNCLR